jgi:tetratricopeptide (TPR) repeat protein
MGQAPSAEAQSATEALLDKAHNLEARGRIDMAAQTWQQVLLADPNNVTAIAGLARAAKLAGNSADANKYLDRLRAINPNDPNIARVQTMMTQQSQTAELTQAGKLAEAGQYAQAMTIYRQVFGSTPPAGDWSLAYYETESATDDGRAHAIAGLRALVDKYPQDSRYQVTLGRILTYNPKTREEGRKLLQRHPDDPKAVEALRQSLVWDSQNPATAADIRAYLMKHNDTQLATALKNQPKRAAAAVPQTPEQIAEAERNRVEGARIAAAYAALNGKRIEEAEQRFKEILSTQPDSGKALAGMGFVRMQQSNFGGAISFLEQAEQDGAKDPGVENALASSRFYYVMGEGAIALNENDLATAEKQYQAALAMRPASPEALEGLGGTLMKAQQPQVAIQVFERYVKVKPSAPAAWRGLFMAQYGAGNATEALLTERRIPAGVHAQLMKDPEFLRTLASAYSSVGRDADAQRVLRSALDLPFPSDARGIKVETQLQYAGLLQQANRLDQAGGLFRQVLAVDPSNTNAWEGLIRVEHAMKQDAQALQTLESMPPSSYDVAMRDPGFESTVASIYQGQNKLDIAQSILEKAISQQTMAGQKPSIATESQLAGIYLQQNNVRQAFPLYRQVLTENPGQTDAWKGLLSALHTSGRDQEVLAQVQQIPPDVRHTLENDVDYLQTIGNVYGSLGQPAQSMVFLNRVKQHYASQNAVAPADIDIQNAYLLFNGSNDTGLYRQLMVLGGRQDLTDEQRRTVQTIWSLWAVRRANQAVAAGNNKKALNILNAAARAFPDNPAVLRALASGYARVGLPKQAVAIFKSQDMTSASAADYKSAVGAALAAGDTKSAETWLRFGLNQYPRDSQMLILGAKFEQARGDNGRAAEYYKASLAAMPPPDPGAELANELSRPVPVPNRLPSMTQPQDLATLLGPGTADTTLATDASQPVQPATPYLPAYNNSFGVATRRRDWDQRRA